MKKYTKPMLIALSISANDMLCSGCNANANDMAVARLLSMLEITDENNNGFYEDTELKGYFAGSDPCETDYSIAFGDVEVYCKHAPESNRLFVS